MLYFFFRIADEVGLDYTPLVVKRLCAHLFDRQGSQNIIVDIFGQKGRMHRSHDSDPDIIAAVAERYRQQADDHWQTVLKNIGRVKQDYRKNQNQEQRQAALEQLKAGASISAIAREFGTSRQTIMRLRGDAVSPELPD